MKFLGKFSLLLVLLCTVASLQAQRMKRTEIKREDGTTITVQEQPINGIVKERILDNKRILAYDTPRESDIMWQKRVWRLLDTREKMNLPFRYPKRYFIEILLDGIYGRGTDLPLPVYRDETFEEIIDTTELSQALFDVDTITVTNPTTYTIDTQIVKNDINYDDIKRFRLTEMWYFDKGAGEMKVRTLGIAPLVPVFSEAEDSRVIGERPLFWINYPEAREYLAREQYFNEHNDASKVSWENVFEMRYFSSFIIKVSNVQDQFLRNMYDDPRQQLLEAEKLKQEIFHFEHDLWSY